MRNFKVGDKVRIIATNHGQDELLLNQLTTIRKLNISALGNDYFIHYYLNGSNYIWDGSELEYDYTFADDFFDKFPNALKDEDGVPCVGCPHHFGYCEYKCDHNCKECWNRPLSEVKK